MHLHAHCNSTQSDQRFEQLNLQLGFSSNTRERGFSLLGKSRVHRGLDHEKEPIRSRAAYKRPTGACRRLLWES
ncbi:hypothetical protein EYF80_031922 [Liparis tanakae]|uniref:Uncharacterized protein n=1 Tax=Liparis tanakae TaxID=230148 RepID=A0A4Z2GX63_9TELE|nr:hypothetical protein EYF80_031922 [Liparis tanakae]